MKGWGAEKDQTGGQIKGASDRGQRNGASNRVQRKRASDKGQRKGYQTGWGERKAASWGGGGVQRRGEESRE